MLTAYSFISHDVYMGKAVRDKDRKIVIILKAK